MSEHDSRPLLHAIPRPGETLNGLTRTAIYMLLKEGKLEARKFGRRTFIEDRSIRRLVASLPSYSPRHAA